MVLNSSGVGKGNGYGYGYSYGVGYSEGYSNDNRGYGYGIGKGYGDGNRSGGGYGKGYGVGYNDGWGYDNLQGQEFLRLVADKLNTKWVLAEEDTEIKRIMMEVMGADRFFAQLEGQVIHQDIDGYGHPRLLIKIPLPDTMRGYVKGVRVTCPTTGRIYFLGVPPECQTCQEAVASTFRIKPDGYHPDRET